MAAVGAKRIGKGIGPPAGHLLDAVLGFLQIGAHGGKILFSGFILALGGAAAGIPGLVQIIGVVLDLNEAAFHHFVHHIPCYMGIVFLVLIQFAVFIGFPYNDGKDRFHIIFLQQGIGIQIVIIVAVIKGDHHWLFRQGCTLLHIGDEVAHHDSGAALPL